MTQKIKTLPLIIFLFCCATFVFADDHETGVEIEKDRKAILSMAGEFEVTFKFMETFAIKKDYELKKPYLAEATEIVFVVKDSPKNIILQHVLWLEDLERIVKHWKQEWKFEDRTLFEFVGNNSWKRKELSKQEAEGTWSQKVYQVDDSPRYESYGKWSHKGGMSSWQGSKTRRPLPRREYTKRKDYEIMMAVNRHTITPLGWFHEQDNYKKVSQTADILCREVGLNNYERTDLVDFSEAKKYWANNANFWKHVSSILNDKMESSNSIFSLRSEVDGGPLYRSLFKLLKDIENEEERKGKARAIIESFIVENES